MTIIRDRSQLAAASTADLLETYNAMTGESVKRFSSREVALRRTDMALMAAADAAGHAGVAPNTQPKPETQEELKARRKPFPEGSLAAQLEQTAKKQEPIVPRPKATPAKKPEGEARRSRPIVAAKALAEGRSKMHSGSARYAVFTHLKRDAFSTLEDLCKATELDAGAVRGHLQKLAEVGWAELQHAE